jgi:hypothetical protein
MPAKLAGASLALIAFAVTMAAGLSVDNPASTTLLRGLIAMPIAYFVGWALGSVGARAMREHIEHYKAERPIERIEESPSRPNENGQQTRQTETPASAARRPSPDQDATQRPEGEVSNTGAAA